MPVSINTPEDSVFIPVRSISVVDSRPDSSAIGLYQLAKLDPRFIVTRESFRAESEKYVNHYVQGSKSDSFSVLMVINKFWISTGYKPDNRRLWDVGEDTSREMHIILSAKMEFFLCKDSGCYILYRFDSVFSATLKKPINIARNEQNSYVSLMSQDALETSLSKLITMEWHWEVVASTKRKFSWHEIETHERKLYEIPLLKDSLLAPGVYLTFEEFKANNPSVRDFQVTKDRLSDNISIKERDGRQMPLYNPWGYCDSSHQVFIWSNHNYFKLQRRQNAFYIYGANQINREVTHRYLGPMMSPYSSQPTSGELPPHEDFKLFLKPFQLDWDSGKLY